MWKTPGQDTSHEYPQHYVFLQNWENITSVFNLKKKPFPMAVNFYDMYKTSEDLEQVARLIKGIGSYTLRLESEY